MTRRFLVLSTIAAAAILLASCSGSSDDDTTSDTGASGDAAVTIVNFSFGPAGVDISVGDTITWTNDPASVGHTATSDDGIWDSSLIKAGNSFDHTFTEAGRFTYFCSIHPSMKASITVNG